jgi:hypothetical protein
MKTTTKNATKKATAVTTKKAKLKVVESPKSKAKTAKVVSITDNAWRHDAAVTAWVKIRRIKAIAEAKSITYAQAAEIDARNIAKAEAAKAKGKKKLVVAGTKTAWVGKPVKKAKVA